jgi:hypothetical protein
MALIYQRRLGAGVMGAKRVRAKEQQDDDHDNDHSGRT